MFMTFINNSFPFILYYNIKNNCIYTYKINQCIYKCLIIFTNGAMTFAKVIKIYSYIIDSFSVQMAPHKLVDGNYTLQTYVKLIVCFI